MSDVHGKAAPMNIAIHYGAGPGLSEHPIAVCFVGRGQGRMKLGRCLPSFLGHDGRRKLRVQGPAKVPGFTRLNFSRCVEMTDLIQGVNPSVGATRSKEMDLLVKDFRQRILDGMSHGFLIPMLLFLPAAKISAVIGNGKAYTGFRERNFVCHSAASSTEWKREPEKRRWLFWEPAKGARLSHGRNRKALSLPLLLRKNLDASRSFGGGRAELCRRLRSLLPPDSDQLLGHKAMVSCRDFISIRLTDNLVLR